MEGVTSVMVRYSEKGKGPCKDNAFKTNTRHWTLVPTTLLWSHLLLSSAESDADGSPPHYCC